MLGRREGCSTPPASGVSEWENGMSPGPPGLHYWPETIVIREEKPLQMPARLPTLS